MLSRYYKFVLEAKQIEEVNLKYSSNFRKVLSNIDGDISTSLLSIESDKLPIKINYIDITDKDDKVSFITNIKSKEIISKNKNIYRYIGGNGRLKHSEANLDIFKLLGYEPIEKEGYKPAVDERAELISKVTSDKSGKTYAYMKFQNGKIGVYNITVFAEDIESLNRMLWNDNRQEMGIGKLTRMLLTSSGIEIKNKELENFIYSYKTAIDKINDKFSLFEIVQGDKIAYYYNRKRYYERKGSLGSSCMSDVSDSYFDIYVKNPEVCSLVILKSEEDDTKIVGRALLWTLINGYKFLDRKYTIKESNVNLFHEYAKSNGWYSKTYNNSSDFRTAFDPKGNIIDIKKEDMIVPIKNVKYKKFPYMDTFKLYFYKDNILKVNIDDYKGKFYILEETDGSYGEECAMCNGEGRVTCSACEGSGNIECDECGGKGEIFKDNETLGCPWCGGSGRIECDECYGCGRVDCPDCS